MKVLKKSRPDSTRPSNLRTILKTKSDLYTYFVSISPKFRLCIYLVWLEHLLVYQKRIFFMLTILIPLSKNIGLLKLLIRRKVLFTSFTGSPFRTIVTGLSSRMSINTPHFLYISGAVYIFSSIYSMYSRLVFSTQSKELTKVILKDQEKYIISKAHHDYVNYLTPIDRSGSILVLVNELNLIWDSFMVFNPAPILSVNLLFTSFIIKEDLPSIISLGALCSTYFTNVFLISSLFMGLFYNYYVKVLLNQTKSQLISYKLFDDFIELLSDFSNKIMSAYALNVVKTRHAKISQDLDFALQTQGQIDVMKRDTAILEGLFEVYMHISVYIFLYVCRIVSPTIPSLITAFCFMLSNQLDYQIIDFALKNYRFNTSYCKVHCALELSTRKLGDSFEQISCIKEDTPTDVQIDKLSFTLVEGGSERKLLSDLSFTIKKGQKLALIGPSGAGKSTLMKLYAGFMGQVPEIKPVNPLWNARTNTMVLAQEPTFYIGSVAENIAGIGGELNTEILSKLGVTNFMLNKTLSYDARELSGGEKQRVALARALHVLSFQNCSTLILDEAFSALDPVSKKDCLDLIFKEFKDKTIIVINHDPSILKRFSKIVYLVAGKVNFCGTHEEFKESSMYNSYSQNS